MAGIQGTTLRKRAGRDFYYLMRFVVTLRGRLMVMSLRWTGSGARRIRKCGGGVLVLGDRWQAILSYELRAEVDTRTDKYKLRSQQTWAVGAVKTRPINDSIASSVAQEDGTWDLLAASHRAVLPLRWCVWLSKLIRLPRIAAVGRFFRCGPHFLG